MREIKFRAWDKNLKQIIPVHDIKFDGCIGVINTNSAWRTFNEIELMQYTGLRDKNGVGIYEGDVFETNLGTIAIIEWDEYNARFLGFTTGKERLIVYVGREPAIKVIGNIYENPELIKEKTASY